MQLGVRQINRAAGVGDRMLELIFEDTKGLPAAGVDAVGELARRGVDVLAGEYHSLVANAVLPEVDRLGLPFVCASATLDAITGRRARRVFRLAPPQSYSWRAYASYLAATGMSRVFAVIEHGTYWEAGAAIIESRLAESGIPFTRLPINSERGMVGAIDGLQASIAAVPPPHMLLLLVSRPDHLRAIVDELRNRRVNSPSLILGDPAGRTIFRDWWEAVGADASGIPFLAYERPGRLTARGAGAARDFETAYGREPSFVALEGYDAILVLAAAARAAGSVDPAAVCHALRHTAVEGTRGTIAFSTEPVGVVHQQWKWPPTCVVVFRAGGQRFSSSEVLWDAEPPSPRPMASG
jgi:ABC-type branched-subunit amino acid transport system substrate-binding protein